MIRILVRTAGGASLLATGYLAALVAAGARRRHQRPDISASDPSLSFAVVVPAHNEEEVIEETLASLRDLDYPGSLVDTVVIADNCTDGTTAIAERGGATVLRRESDGPQGKGRALAWAFSRISEWESEPDAIVVVDADCRASPTLLHSISERFHAGAKAAQVNYVVANPEASAETGLRYAGFALMNTARPMGKEALGLSSGLFGTGMAFSRELLERMPWDAFSLAEDSEYHLKLVDAGHRVTFVADAEVRSSMPTTASGLETQDRRWEGGRPQLARTWFLRLLARGISERDPVRINAAWELLIPSQSLMLAANLGVAVAGRLFGDRPSSRLGMLSTALQAAAIVGALNLADAPPSAYRSLAHSPALVLRKLRLYLSLGRDGGPATWVRTPRDRPSD